jgi:hypothetical protein
MYRDMPSTRIENAASDIFHWSEIRRLHMIWVIPAKESCLPFLIFPGTVAVEESKLIDAQNGLRGRTDDGHRKESYSRVSN